MEYSAEDILNLEKTGDLLHSFCSILNISASIIDPSGRILTESSWQPICKDFHRAHEGTRRRCFESDTVLARPARETKEPCVYACLNGLNHAVSPIVINGRHVASVFVGQFLTAAPDKEFFRRQAAENGFPEEAYLSALSRVPIIQEDRFLAVLNFITAFAAHLAMIGLDSLNRCEAEQALVESEKKFRNLLVSLQEGIWAIDKDGLTIFVNPRMGEMLGYSLHEMAGKHLYDFMDEEETRIAAEKLERRKQGIKEQHDFVFRHKEGGRIWTSLETSPLLDEQGNFCGAIACVADISERKKAEEALRESEARMRSLFNAITETVILIDREGIILAANDVLAKRLGRRAGEFPGKRLFDFFPASIAESRKEAADKVVRTGKPMQTVDEREGRIYRTHWYPVFDDKGAVTQVAVFGADITETRSLETRLMQAQKMEAIGTLAGGIAHDFNNLLMGIQGRISLMLLDIPPSHPFLEHLKAVEQYVQSAANLTKQLLGFAKGGKYQTRVLDLNELVMRGSSLFGRTKKEITIHCDFEQPLWPVEADPGQIEQVLLNLYLNAWQAMPGGGELFLETRNVTLDEERVEPFGLSPGRYARICVTDTGVGMVPALVQKIFDPFFSTKGTGKGTGLGLATAYGIIANHGGFIEVSSQPGEGTTFSLFLPATERAPDPAAQGRKEIARGTETILLVDDEEMILDVTKEILEKTGYRVVTARSGREAVERYAESREDIDLVLLDIIMPEMGGEATLAGLQRINPGVKVLLASGYSVEGEASRMIARGCRGFVQKPFLLQELSKKIREALA